MTDRATQSRRDGVLSRRAFVAATTTAVGATLAGCTGLTSQSFEASPVGLPGADQDELHLAETSADSETVSRTGPADSEVEITNHAAVYSRAAGLGGR